MLLDAFGRPFRSLRISVTDRCNFRCFYCHNEGQGGPVAAPRAPRPHELTAPEIARVATVARRLGVESFKLTGGEPLVRADLEDLVARLARLGAPVSLTTNGSLLAGRAEALAAAGLSRVNVSLDSLDAAEFRAIRGGDLGSVLAGIDAAVAAGLAPVKLNLVLLQATQRALAPMLRHVAATPGLELQLIQFMPEMAQQAAEPADVDAVRQWLASQADEVVVRESHRRHRYRIGRAWVELVDPVGNAAFCGACDRLRLTADGRLKGCINVNAGAPGLRGLDEDGIEAAFRQAVATRRPFYGTVVPAATSAPAAP